MPSNGKYGARTDGTSKGDGWLGPLPTRDGQTMTELSMEMEMDGKSVLLPLLVPTLTQEEVEYLASGARPTKGIVEKAVSHAKGRMGEGKSPFKD